MPELPRRRNRQRILEFQESITKELSLTKDRVEFLIGNANWGAVGSYKEAILRRSISQFLPTNLNIGTGFIIGNTDLRHGQNEKISTQLDIIIYEDKSPVIFREGDFIIITESAVRAVIEVKTKIINFSELNKKGNDNALNKIVHKINKLLDFETFNTIGEHRKKFIGIFCYDYDTDFTSEMVDEALRLSNGLVNHISLGPNNFIRYWENTDELDPRPGYQGRCYLRYNLTNLSFSYFISNLIHIVSDEDPIERYWFSFPIEGTKERYRAEPRPIIELR
jgi:hypothetical protein